MTGSGQAMTGGGERARWQSRVIHELAVVHQLSATQFNRALKPLGLSMTQVSVMARLSGPAGASVGELAAVMEINQPGVSKIVGALAERGAVKIATAEGDGRRRVVRLTPAGRRLLARAREALHPEATLAFSDLDDARLADLHALLAIVSARLMALPPDQPDPA